MRLSWSRKYFSQTFTRNDPHRGKIKKQISG